MDDEARTAGGRRRWQQWTEQEARAALDDVNARAGWSLLHRKPFMLDVWRGRRPGGRRAAPPAMAARRTARIEIDRAREFPVHRRR